MFMAIGGLVKRRKLFNYLKQQRHDIVMLQETHSSLAEEELWCKQWEGKIFFNHGETNARGVCTLVRKGLHVEEHNVQKDKNGQYLIVQLQIMGLCLALANIYAPNTDDVSLFSKSHEGS